MLIRVLYHGSVRECHGLALLVGIDPDHEDRYVLRSLRGPLTRVRRESFTILDDDPENAALDDEFSPVSA